MIVGIGTDIARVSRFEQNADNIAKRCCTEQELLEMESKKGAKISAVAKRFAAKEACVKALGTGFSSGISFQDIEIFHHQNGRPDIRLRGKAAERMKELCEDKGKIFLSLSDEKEYVVAMVVIERL